MRQGRFATWGRTGIMPFRPDGDTMASTDLDCPEIGHAAIDAQHRDLRAHLLSLVDEVNAGSAATVRARMGVVVEQVSAHFQFEERLMQESAFPNQTRHKEAHDTFVADLRKFDLELAAKGITPNFRRWAVGRLLEWFRFHVVANDVELGKFLAKRR